MAISELDLARAAPIPAGGSFLLCPVGSAPILTAEGFTEEQRAYYATMRQFMDREVMPNVARLEAKDLPLLRELLRKAGELGLLMVEIPEAYGGLDLDVTTAMLVAEATTSYAAWSVTLGGHVGIGTLPIVYFGSEAQKQKYLPKLATAEWVAAYCLTEPTSGSDALSAKTVATLASDGTHYLLNGTKQFITNAGIADLFVVFAKIDGQKFTGFLVERTSPGLSIGAEEHKMGIRGSSTCQVILEEVKVPVENLLGDIGKGHKIAFNILNLGRLKLGVGSVGGARDALRAAVSYSHDRRQFGQPLQNFGLIREKLARMTTAIYALESMAYRTCGLIDDQLRSLPAQARADHDKKILAVEEYSIEASILKVAGSEILEAVVDEALQIHGGYGYIADYPIERGYRDSRINRLYEGTNEINRMLITGMLLKRALRGQLPLLEAMAGLQTALPSFIGPLAAERAQAEQLKRMALLALKTAVERFGPALEERQEVLAAVADVVTEAFALDSALARSLQVGESDPRHLELRQALVALYAFEALPRAFARARTAICASAQGADLSAALALLDALLKAPPIDPVAARETIVAAVLARGGYPLGH